MRKNNNHVSTNAKVNSAFKYHVENAGEEVNKGTSHERKDNLVDSTSPLPQERYENSWEHKTTQKLMNRIPSLPQLYYCKKCKRYTDVNYVQDKVDGASRPKSYCYKCNDEMLIPINVEKADEDTNVPRKANRINTSYADVTKSSSLPQQQLNVLIDTRCREYIEYLKLGMSLNITEKEADNILDTMKDLVKGIINIPVPKAEPQQQITVKNVLVKTKDKVTKKDGWISLAELLETFLITIKDNIPVPREECKKHDNIYDKGEKCRLCVEESSGKQDVFTSNSEKYKTLKQVYGFALDTLWISKADYEAEVNYITGEMIKRGKEHEAEVRIVETILLDVLNQCTSEVRYVIDNQCTSPYEVACKYLKSKGYLKSKNGRIYRFTQKAINMFNEE